MKVLSAEEVKAMSPEEFREVRTRLNRRMSRMMLAFTRLAKQVDVMEKSCSHVNSEPAVSGKWCHDCEQYVKVKIDFSPETEKWFEEQNKIATELNPMTIIKVI